MICVVCHHGQTRPGTTTIAFHRQGRTVVVTEVPAEVCENCQEPYVGEAASARVLEIAGEARQALSQILVRDFTVRDARETPPPGKPMPTRPASQPRLTLRLVTLTRALGRHVRHPMRTPWRLADRRASVPRPISGPSLEPFQRTSRLPSCCSRRSGYETTPDSC